MDNKLIFQLLLLLTKNMDALEDRNIYSLESCFQSIKINLAYTRKKVEMAKRLVSYIPQHFYDSYVKSLAITEILMQVLEFQNTYQDSSLESHESPKTVDKVNLDEIVKILREEMAQIKEDELGVVLSVIANLNKDSALSAGL